MKIVLDFRKYDGVIGGVEQGVIQLTQHVTQMDHSIVLLCKRNRQDKIEALFRNQKNLKIIPLDIDTHVFCKKNAHLDSTVIQDIAKQESAEIIHFPYNWSFPEKKKAPSVLTIHDVIPFTFREAQKFFLNQFKYRPSIKKAARLNDIIATVSEFSKQDIAKKVGVPLDKIRVIYNGIRTPSPENKTLESELKEKFGLHDGIILNVGGIHERKNIVRLIQAFAKLRIIGAFNGKLVITGSIGGAPYQVKMRSQCEKAVKELGLQDYVIFTGFLSDEEVDTLFRIAELFVYPSLYEGFGIPILEAMQLGVPVITSQTTALPEVAGDAALLIDPLCTKSMETAMAELLKNGTLREELKSKGIKRAKDFSWAKNAKAYLSLYDELIKNHS